MWPRRPQKTGNAPRLGNARRGDRGLRQPGLRKRPPRSWPRSPPGRDSSPWPQQHSSASTRTAPPKPPSPQDAPTRRTSPGPRSSAPRCAKKLAAGTPAPVDAAKLKDAHTPLVPMLRFIRFVVGYRRRQKKKPGRLPARMRCRPLHPLRPLRRNLPDAGRRAGRRGAHRPCALYPLLRLRQGMSGRSTEFPPPSPQPSHAASPGANNL